MKKTLIASLLATAFSGAAFAQSAPASEHAVSGTATVASEYRYRGLMQSFGQPALQGGIDYAHANGVYLGNWNSSISWLADAGVAGSGSLEMDFYGGYKTEISGVTLDVGGLYYYYPVKNLIGTNPNTFELYAAASYGPATLKYSHALTNIFANARSKNSYYLDLSLKQDLGMYGLTASAHVGYQKIKGVADDAGSYTDWTLGLAKDFGDGFTLSAAYIGTNAKKSFYTFNGKYFGKAAGVVSLTKAF